MGSRMDSGVKMGSQGSFNLRKSSATLFGSSNQLKKLTHSKAYGVGDENPPIDPMDFLLLKGARTYDFGTRFFRVHRW